MMKRVLKSALTLVLIVATLFTLSPLALAAKQPTIKIMLNNKTLNVSPILCQGGRTYVPYDSFFKAIGASAKYDAKAQTITVVSGTTTVIFNIDTDEVDISANGVDDYFSSYSEPIVDTISGKIYISLRSAAQALGYVVSWDSPSHTITLQSVEDLMQKSGATYNVMDKYLAFNKDFLSKNKALTGTFSLTANMNSIYNYRKSPDSETKAPEIPPLTINGTATGVFDKSGSEMSINLKSNASAVIPQLVASEELDAKTKAILEKLNNTDISMIINNETGFLYIKSPLICAITGQEEDAWICLETGETLSYSQMTDLSEFSFVNIGDVSNFKDYVTMILKRDLLYDDGSSTVDTLKDLNSRYSDQAMVKNGDDYVINYSYDDSDEDYIYQSKESSKLVFDFNGTTFAGISYTTSSSACYPSYYDDEILSGDVETSSTEVSYSFTAAGKGSMSIKQVANGVTELSVAVDYTFSDTTKTPAREPAEGSNVVSIYSLGDLEQAVTSELNEVGLTA